MVGLTLTHGGGFGAQVTVDGLGLVLGHGMSRFDPRPGMPNSPGPGKRPLHNMCPTVVLRGGRPRLALGAAGGRKIVNSVFEVLAHYAGRDAPVETALAAPRLHTEGDMKVVVDVRTPEPDAAYLREIGYTVQRGAGANVSAVSSR
jgi:gamma-glutamyltranspeptidase / glutathione hydrolase